MDPHVRTNIVGILNSNKFKQIYKLRIEAGCWLYYVYYKYFNEHVQP